MTASSNVGGGTGSQQKKKLRFLFGLCIVCCIASMAYQFKLHISTVSVTPQTSIDAPTSFHSDGNRLPKEPVSPVVRLAGTSERNNKGGHVVPEQIMPAFELAKERNSTNSTNNRTEQIIVKSGPVVPETTDQSVSDKNIAFNGQPQQRVVSERGKEEVIQQQPSPKRVATPAVSVSSNNGSSDRIRPEGVPREERIPIMELLHPISSSSEQRNATTCPDGLVYVNDTHLPRDITHVGRKIPRIIHVTGKTRCVTQAYFDNLNKWRSFPNHSFYFHDDDAIDRLFMNDGDYWHEEYPKLRDVLHCITAGATRADLWRYLVLWEYGGLYTDMDATPRKLNEGTIEPEDDGFLLVDSSGIYTQWLMAMSRRHPLMNYTLNEATVGLRQTGNVMMNVPAHNTGPHALKVAFQQWMNDATVAAAAAAAAGGGNNTTTYTGYEGAGYYVDGIHNRSLRVIGSAKRRNEYAHGAGIGRANKDAGYIKMNISHHLAQKRQAFDDQDRIVSCEMHIQNVHNSSNHNSSTTSTRPEDMYRIHLVTKKPKKPKL